MQNLTILSPTNEPLTVEVEDTSTLLELRFRLFSLTDIPPDRIVFYVSSARFEPNDDRDETLLLSAIGVNSNAVLRFADANSEMKMKELQDALKCTSDVPAPKAINIPLTVQAKQFLDKVRSYHAAILEYEDSELQAKALKVLPMEELEKNARELQEKEPEKYSVYGRAFIKSLLAWFKESFFNWVDAPVCWSCSNKTKLAGVVAPSEHEAKYRASRTEFFICEGCQAQIRFPRYNDAGKLLETRKGRCGEWVQAFTLMVRTCGYEVRAVHDWTDHVWSEIFLEGEDGIGEWVHADSCENSLNEPLMYEAGWGKKLNYCIATGKDCVLDVTKRYTKDWPGVQGRRNILKEDVLHQSLEDINDNVVGMLSAERQKVARERYEKEKIRLEQGENGSTEGLGGRSSGSKAWVDARGEGGVK